MLIIQAGCVQNEIVLFVLFFSLRDVIVVSLASTRGLLGS